MKKEAITIDDFVKVDIRVGLVTEAKAVPNSKKLIQLTVDLGADYGLVTILTGLLAYYPEPSVLANKKYLFLTNLAPRVMAGIESQGMFLALDNGTTPCPISVAEETPVGSHVH